MKGLLTTRLIAVTAIAFDLKKLNQVFTRYVDLGFQDLQGTPYIYIVL